MLWVRVYPIYIKLSSKLRPVISSGFFIFKISKMVGATSARDPRVSFS